MDDTDQHDDHAAAPLEDSEVGIPAPVQQRHLRLAGASPEADPDADLVRAAQNGDQRAFGTLYERHYGRIRAVCMRMLRDDKDAEDAVQHAFLEAWRCLDRFEGRSRFTTWLTRIAIHTSFSTRRRVKRWFLTDDGDVGDGLSSTISDRPSLPDDGAAHRARKKAVDDILQKLSQKKRVVFVLAEFEGMTAPEIATIVNIPEATVRTRLFHARKEFAKRARVHPGFEDLFADGGMS